MKFHISKSGAVAPCVADVRSCPRGGAEVHFDTAQEAALAAVNAEMFSLPAQRDFADRERIARKSDNAAELQEIAEGNAGYDYWDHDCRNLDELVAKNKHINEETAIMLARRNVGARENFTVVWHLHREHGSAAVLDVLADSRNMEAVERIAESENVTAATLQHIADRIPDADDKWSLREWGAIARAVAGNANADADVLLTVARKAMRFKDVRHALAFNQSTPREILDRLTRSKDLGVTAWVAEHPNADERILRKLLKNSELMSYNGQLAREILAARAVPAEVLADWARQGRGVGALKAVAEHPKATKEILAAVAAREGVAISSELDDMNPVWAAIIRNQNADEEVLTATVANRDLDKQARNALMGRDPDLYHLWFLGVLDSHDTVVERSV